LELDFENSLVKNLTKETNIKGPALSPDLINIVKKGGILKMLDRTGS
jgi:hypothetical protein